MHLDTVFTFCDRTVATIYEPVVSRDRARSATCRTATAACKAEVVDRPFLDEVKDALGLTELTVDPHRRRRVRGRAQPVGRRQQRRRARAGRRRRLRAQRGHQHEALQGRYRGARDRRPGARPRPRRRPLHDLSRDPRRLKEADDHRHRSPRRRPALRGRHLLTLNDYTAEEITLPARPRRRAQGGQARRPRGADARGQGDRADLREGLDAHALRVRGRRLRPGRARHLHRADRLAHGPQGVRQGHRARARPHVRRDRVPRLRRGDRRRARASGRACRSTTASPTSGTRPRCSPTS